MQLTLVVTGLLDIAPSLLAPADTTAPAFERLLAAAEAPIADTEGRVAIVCAALGVIRQRDWPVGPLLARAMAPNSDAKYWLCADPATLEVGRDDVRLRAMVSDLGDAETAALLATLNAHFAADGLRFIAPTAQHWLVACAAVPALATRGPDADAYLVALRRYFEFRLERARRFLWALSTPEPATPIRYVLFGGDCELTPARLAIEDVGGIPVARLNPDGIRNRLPGVAYDELMLEPGDGLVTKPSILARETLDPSSPQNEDSFIPIAYWFFLCEHHDQLTGNVNFQDNLLNVLLTRTLPWEMVAPAP